MLCGNSDGALYVVVPVHGVDAVDQRNAQATPERVALVVVDHVGPLSRGAAGAVGPTATAAEHGANAVRGDVVLVPDVRVGDLRHLTRLLGEGHLRQAVGRGNAAGRRRSRRREARHDDKRHGDNTKQRDACVETPRA